jgi:uncharacterized membrane protein HdeD (DUF308 family)
LAKKIWIFAIVRGVLAIIFGLIAFFSPIATAIALSIVIGAYAIVIGVFDIIEAIRQRGRPRWCFVSCWAPSASSSGSLFSSGRA